MNLEQVKNYGKTGLRAAAVLVGLCLLAEAAVFILDCYDPRAVLGIALGFYAARPAYDFLGRLKFFQ